MFEKKLSWLYSVFAAFFVGAVIWLLVHSLVTLDYEWDFAFLLPYIWQSDTGEPGVILKGLWGTFYISSLSIFFGSIIGVLIGLLLISKEPVSRKSAHVYVDIFRNTPVLVQLYLAYFVIGTALELTAEQAGIMTLSLFCSAYVGEIFRGTIRNFEKGQFDAAKSLGLAPRHIASRIVMPQALRRMLPPLVGQFVSLVKDSSLVSVISIVELTKSASNVVAVSFRSFETWFFIAFLYLIINTILSSFGRYLEDRLSVSLK